MTVITISRVAGSAGDEVARRVCELLDYHYFDKTLMSQVAQEMGISEAEVVDFSEDSYKVRSFVDALLRRPAPVSHLDPVGVDRTGPGDQDWRQPRRGDGSALRGDHCARAA